MTVDKERDRKKEALYPQAHRVANDYGTRALIVIRSRASHDAAQALLDLGGDPAEEDTPVALVDQPRAGLYTGGAFKAVFTDSLRSTLRVV